jgi:hypothetical protein
MGKVSLRRVVSALLGSLALGVPFVVAAHNASSLVTPLATTAVAGLLRATALLQPAAAATPEPDADEVAPIEPAALTFDVATKPAARRSFKAPQKPGAVFVSEASVLKLAKTAARPQGAFVAQTAQHPAGLRLSGVAALGIGVQDGDILIEALGATPRSPGQVIGAILEARAKQARFLSGTLWRNGQTFRITVEQPYVDARSPS